MLKFHNYYNYISVRSYNQSNSVDCDTPETTMFSGIKYIFGYTDDSNEESPGSPSSAQATLSSSSSPKDNEQATTGAMLEQTLNAATTKFTEQLLPQQASIEQLQSSSHQLLPTLNEKLEEDKLVRPAEESVSCGQNNDDDDDCFNPDSWEMLDLNEKATAGAIDEAREVTAEQEVNSTVQGGGVIISKSSSGILKTNDSSNSANMDDTQRQQKQRQQQLKTRRPKPKVSFETPDLVKDEHKIEKINNNDHKSKQEEPNGQPKRNKNKKNRNKQAEGTKSKPANVVDVASAGDVAAVKEVQQGEEEGLTTWPVMPQQAGVSVTAKQSAPVLNYSAVLSSKPRIALIKGFVRSGSVEDEPQVKSSGAVKRNRPLSTSSWSSNDHLENDDDANVWDDIKQTIKEGPAAGSSLKDADDNESIMSSGFSDCDYGYDGFNDFVMKPKRSGISKSGRNGSTSRVHHVKRPRRGPNQSAASCEGQSSSTKSRKVGPNAVAQVTATKPTLPRASKPDKKKSTASVGPKSSDFLKGQSNENKNNDKLLEPIATTSSNDSSDIADMDESWYVTPPPCFTGANKSIGDTKVKQSKPKGDELDARENALIEHPSVYIASTSSKAPKVSYTSKPAASKHVQVDLKPIATASPIVPKKKTPAIADDDGWNSDEDDQDFDCQLASTRPVAVQVEPPKKQKLVKKAPKQEFKLVSSKKSSQVEWSKEAASKPMNTGEKKAWQNKFMVDDWNLDDQEDPASDFDDMFESPRNKKSLTKQTKKKQQRQQQRKLSPVDSGPALVDFDSDVSIGSTNEGNRSSSIEVVFKEEIKSTGASLLETSADDAEMLQENQQPDGQGDLSRPSSSPVVKSSSARPPVPVKPIEPERKPGWQLKRQRSKRRPLASTNNSSNSPSSKLQRRSSGKAAGGGKGGKSQLSSSSSDDSSARSTPTLIDRIGSSIVANLNNLAGGFASSPIVVGATAAAGNRARSGLIVDEQDHQQSSMRGGVNSMATFGASEQHDLQLRKRLSKGFLRRQNVNARQANSQRRPDRRLRMFATQNGVSVNRKVHTNFH